ncbi:hypothetical protein [Streptomyces sp. NPDC051561]|uniref:hypothetical protein n=1 Tax=Streptomyces sp. NPDC051561 TaxID=3365658 RepID=UPI00378A07E1
MVPPPAGAAVVLVNGLCVWGLSDSATPGNAHVLSLVAMSCLLGARVAAAWRPLLVLAGCAAVDSRHARCCERLPYGGSTR